MQYALQLMKDELNIFTRHPHVFDILVFVTGTMALIFGPWYWGSVRVVSFR